MEPVKKSTNPAGLFRKFAKNGLVEAVISSGNDAIRTFKGVAIATAIIAVPAFGIQTIKELPQFMGVAQEIEKNSNSVSAIGGNAVSEIEWMEQARKQPEHANMLSMLQSVSGRHATDDEFVEVFRSIKFEDMQFLGEDQVEILFEHKEDILNGRFYIKKELVYSRLFESWFEDRPINPSADYKAWEAVMQNRGNEKQEAFKKSLEDKRASGSFLDDVRSWFDNSSAAKPAPKI